MAFSSTQHSIPNTTNAGSDHKEIQFQDLTTAINAKQAELVSLYVKAKPQLVLQTDDDKNTPLHLALTLQNPEIISLIIAALLEINKLNEVIYLTNSKHETVLHAAVLCEFTVIKSIVALLGPAINTLARVCDNLGRIPLNILIDDPKRSEIERESIMDLILPATLFNPLIKFNQELNTADIIKQYGSSFPNTLWNSSINTNLTVACEIINRTRKIIKTSYSHPENNLLNSAEFKKSAKLINDDLRSAYMDKHSKIFTSWEKVFKHIEKIQAGNCDEMSWYCLHQLFQHYPNVKGELFQFNSHVFLVLGRKDNSDANDPSTWGYNAVICDPWSGKAFPATPKKISEELHGWYYIEVKYRGAIKYCNVLTKYKNTLSLFLKDEITKKIKNLQPPKDEKGINMQGDNTYNLVKLISLFGRAAVSTLTTDKQQKPSIGTVTLQKG